MVDLTRLHGLEFADDLENIISRLGKFSEKYALPAPTLLLAPHWRGPILGNRRIKLESQPLRDQARIGNINILFGEPRSVVAIL